MEKNYGIKEGDILEFDLEMLQIDYSENKIGTLRKEIAEKYGVPMNNVKINFTPITFNPDGEKISLTKDVINNVQDPEFQRNLFKEFLLTYKDKDNVNFDEIITIDNMINAYVNFDAYKKYKSYKIKSIAWNNYLSYGPNNYFDFTTLEGLVLLNGEPENQCGKTTFAVDLLRFALFGKAKKSPTLESVFNGYLPDCTQVSVEAIIEIDDVNYKIRRVITRPSLKQRQEAQEKADALARKENRPPQKAKVNVKQKVEFYKISPDGTDTLLQNCEEESGTQTNNVIGEAVGSMEDYNLVISATASSLEELLQLGQTKKSELFSRWLGLQTIEDKEARAKEYYNKNVANKLLGKVYTKVNLMNEIENAKNVIKDSDEELVSVVKNVEEAKKRLAEMDKQKTDTLSRKKEVKEELNKLDVTHIEKSIEGKQAELQREQAKLVNNQKEYETVKDATFDENLYKDYNQKYRDTNTQLTRMLADHAHLKADNTRIEGLISKGVCPTCGHKVELDEQQGFINTNLAKMNEISGEGSKIRAYLNELDSKIKAMDGERPKVNKAKEINLRMIAINTNIENIKLSIENFERQKKEIEQNKENIELNNRINKEIEIINTSIRTENDNKDKLLTAQQRLLNNKKNAENEIIEKEKLIKRIDEEDALVRNWTAYLSMLGKNGIIKIALQQALPIINGRVNELLSGLVDFSVELKVTPDSKVSMEFIRDGINFDLSYASSGYETVMASLALRMGLALVGNMPRPNILVLDEIIGPVGQSNFENLRELFARILKMGYQAIIHICHESMADDWHTKTITVQRKGKISYIAQN